MRPSAEPLGTSQDLEIQLRSSPLEEIWGSLFFPAFSGWGLTTIGIVSVDDCFVDFAVCDNQTAECRLLSRPFGRMKYNGWMFMVFGRRGQSWFLPRLTSTACAPATI
jgi:hypothetical protein